MGITDALLVYKISWYKLAVPALRGFVGSSVFYKLLQSASSWKQLVRATIEFDQFEEKCCKSCTMRLLIVPLFFFVYGCNGGLPRFISILLETKFLLTRMQALRLRLTVLH